MSSKQKLVSVCLLELASRLTRYMTNPAREANKPSPASECLPILARPDRELLLASSLERRFQSSNSSILYDDLGAWSCVARLQQLAGDFHRVELT